MGRASVGHHMQNDQRKGDQDLYYRCDLSTNVYLELICELGQDDDLFDKSLITQTSSK